MKWWKGMVGLEADISPAERKEIAPIGASGLEEWSRQDGENFRTNSVSLAEFEDSGDAGGALALSAVFACCRLLAGTIATLPLEVLQGRGGGAQRAFNHPLYRTLHDSPNADQTAVDFWELIVLCLELSGNAYAPIRRSGARVVALDPPVQPGAMNVSRARNGELRYRWTDENGRQQEKAQAEILHIRGFGGGPLGGLSTLSYARRSFGLAGSIERAAGRTFRNGVRPSGVIETDLKLTPTQRNEANDALEQKYAGAMNAGRPMLLDNGLKWKAVSMNPEDAQMLQSRGFSVEEICRFFGVPPFMVGHTEKQTSWGTGIEQQTLGFQKLSLLPRLKRIEQSLEKQLLTAGDRAANVGIEFNLEGLLRGDSAGRAAFYKEMAGLKAMTVNEIRAKENLPRVPWGDRPWGQVQDVQLDEAGQLPPRPEGSVNVAA